jgi:hypothetical protein
MTFSYRTNSKLPGKCKKILIETLLVKIKPAFVLLFVIGKFLFKMYLMTKILASTMFTNSFSKVSS